MISDFLLRCVGFILFLCILPFVFLLWLYGLIYDLWAKIPSYKDVKDGKEKEETETS